MPHRKCSLETLPILTKYFFPVNSIFFTDNYAGNSCAFSLTGPVSTGKVDQNTAISPSSRQEKYRHNNRWFIQLEEEREHCAGGTKRDNSLAYQKHCLIAVSVDIRVLVISKNANTPLPHKRG